MDVRVVDGSGSKSLQPDSPPPPPPCAQNQIETAPQFLAGGISGGIAGAFSKTCTAPFARLTILFQVQGMHSDTAVLSKTSIWREAVRIVNEEGFRAFWKGNLVTITHRLPCSAVNFYCYDYYKCFLKSAPAIKRHSDNASADSIINFISGGSAGMTAAAATYPLDLVRTRLSAQRSDMYYRGIWHAIRTICKDEGFLGLYKGLGTTLLGVGPTLAITFSVYEALKSYWQSRRPDDITVITSLACGGLSGIASSTATFPLDLVRRRMQLEGVAGQARVYNTGLIGTFGHIFRNEGPRGFYRGIISEYFKVFPSAGIVFMTLETLRKLLSNEL